MKLLLIEDEKQLSDALCQILIKNKYETTAAYDGERGLDEALSRIYDIILLDIMLPQKNGLEILRRIRSEGISTPVLLLTAKGEISDRVRGLDYGADDYLPKPFATEELLARIRALSRRKGEWVKNELCFSDLCLNLSTYELFCDGLSVKLSNKEFEIMRYLLMRPRIVVGKEDLLTRLWGYENAAVANNLEVYISFLRKKMIFLKTHVKIICLRNVGYQLEETVCSEI